MDYTTSKAFIIGVGIFVTLTIVSLFIVVLNIVVDIYNSTETTDTSIIAQFDNLYSMYSGAELNALNLMNTLRKYETDTTVRIGVKFKTNAAVDYGDGSNVGLLEDIEKMYFEGKLEYERRFIVKVEETEAYVRLIFMEK